MLSKEIFPTCHGSVVTKSVLDNGVTVLVDSASHFRTCAFSITLRGGARDETPGNAGLTHLVEHLVFKRTSRKSTKDIASVIDSFGGEINASTDPENCCLFGVVPVERAGELLAFFRELLFESLFESSDIELEKEVIRQEILEAQDDPDDVVYQKFSEEFWPDSSLALPVFGYLESLNSFTQEDVQNRLREILKGKRIVIGASGDISSEMVVDFAQEVFGSLDEGVAPSRNAPNIGSGIELITMPVNQCYLTLGKKWPSFKHPDYLPGVVLTTILGDGMSSRLFQVVREERGLAYDVNAETVAYQDTGALLINATLERQKLDLSLELILAEMKRLEQDSLCEEEFKRAVCMLIAQTEMEADSVSSRMWRAVETEIDLGRYVGVDDIVNMLNSLKVEDVSNMVKKWFAEPEAVLILGGKVDDYDPDLAVKRFCRV